MIHIHKHFKFVFRLFLFVILFISFLIAVLFVYDFHISSPYDVIISDVSPTSATLTWKTKKNIPTYLLLNDTVLLGDGEVSKFHRIEINNLEESSTFSFDITDGSRYWNTPSRRNSESMLPLLITDFNFNTIENPTKLYIPRGEVMTVLPNELVYAVLYNEDSNSYSDIKSAYANQFGGVVFDLESFNKKGDGEYILKKIDYSIQKDDKISLLPKVYSSEINCNKSIPYIPSNAISREAYAQLADRWVAGRGKNYAYECFNDVVYRSKVAGVDPAFTLAVWLNESAASNYTLKKSLYGLIEDFGIHGKASVPPQNFNLQITRFLELSHVVRCKGLTAWESWGNYYRYGTCNQNDPVQRAEGIDYYKKTELIYKWITNGSRLPARVTGLTKMKPFPEVVFEYEEKCCVMKLEHNESFVGVYDELKVLENCTDRWKTGKSLKGSVVEYAIEVENFDRENKCELNHQGVCCKFNNGIKWYPEEECKNVLTEIKDSGSCNNYMGDRACYMRDGKYQWLPKLIGGDYLVDVIEEPTCLSRNELTTFKMSLKKGVNIIGFDLTPVLYGTTIKASNLIREYPEISVIANFKENTWKDILLRSSEVPYAGNDFLLKQNSGYLFILSKDLVISFDGWKDSSTAYSSLDEGWNLVGGSIYSGSKKASLLISNLKEKDISINTVAVWSPELESIIYQTNDKDISFSGNMGIFIR